jgi:OOP family OmpA-OmpF porin
MRPDNKALREAGLLTVAVMLFAAPAAPARGQGTVTESLVGQLVGLETAADLDLPALREQAIARIKSRADNTPLKRPPLAAGLRKLPQVNVEVQFDADSPIVRPPSYQVLGRIADALTDPRLSHYSFLIVGHTEATGRREPNLALSQRRADAIREVLVSTFKLSPKRLQAVGLGEEQLLDSEHPAAAINQQVQVVTVGKMP